MTSRKTPQLADAERFFAKVDTSGDCWLWTASTHPFGHGQFYAGGHKFYAHRWLYELFVAPIPDGLHLDHLCRVPECVRPSHLEPVTNAENILRGTGPSALNANKTHCPQGHPYNEINTHTTAAGGRSCRTCHREVVRRGPRGDQALRASALGNRKPCSVCGGVYRVRDNGTLFRHKGLTPDGLAARERCAGSGQPPRAADQPPAAPAV